jgi:c-di-GMP-related signal transduction protein
MKDPHPVSLRTVIVYANRRDGCPKALLSILDSRPELARWLIDTINSERFSLGVTVTSVRHAMITVGQNTFRQLVLVTATLPPSI